MDKIHQMENEYHERLKTTKGHYDHVEKQCRVLTTTHDHAVAQLSAIQLKDTHVR